MWKPSDRVSLLGLAGGPAWLVVPRDSVSFLVGNGEWVVGTIIGDYTGTIIEPVRIGV